MDHSCASPDPRPAQTVRARPAEGRHLNGLVYCSSSVAATVLLGLMAGFFFAFAIDVAPAMARLDGPGYTAVQQWINRMVRNAPFAVAYFGSALLVFVPALAAGLARRWPHALAWSAVALSYFVAVFWVTRRINVPINEAMALWDPSAPPADWQLLRDRWNQANGWRAAASALCFSAAVLLTARPPARRAAR